MRSSEHFGLDAVPHFIEALSHVAEHAPAFGAAAGWLTFAACAAAVGSVIGSVIVAITHAVVKRKH